MSKHTNRREINEALQVPKPPMTKEEAFRGFTDEDALLAKLADVLNDTDYLRKKRNQRNDSGV